MTLDAASTRRSSLARAGWFLSSVVAMSAVAACTAPSAPSAPTGPASTNSLTITGTTLLTAIGQTSQLTVTNGAGAPVSDVTWGGGNAAVSVNSSGLITALAFGTAGLSVRASSTLLANVTVYVLKPGALPPTTLTACATQPVTTQGSYVLSSDLSGTTFGPCLALQNLAMTQLDCGGHMLPGLSLNSVNTVTISNCTIPNFVNVNNSQTVTFNNCTIGGGFIVSSTSGAVVTNSRIAMPPTSMFAIQLINVTSGRLSQNIFTGGNGGSATIYLYGGSGNQVLQNTITGGYDGADTFDGTDDGVLLINETGDTVQGNTISNFFDTGVEGVDLVTNSTIAGNSISNAGTTAIGTYWCTNWSNNVVANNTVTQSPLLFFMKFNVGLGQCGTSTVVLGFSGNQFIGNQFGNAAVGDFPSEGGVPVPGGRVSGFGAEPRMVINMTGAVSGNVLQGNNFGSYDGPYLTPLAGFVDGGGNICGPMNPHLSNFACSGGAPNTPESLGPIPGRPPR